MFSAHCLWSTIISSPSWTLKKCPATPKSGYLRGVGVRQKWRQRVCLGALIWLWVDRTGLQIKRTSYKCSTTLPWTSASSIIKEGALLKGLLHHQHPFTLTLLRNTENLRACFWESGEGPDTLRGFTVCSASPQRPTVPCSLCPPTAASQGPSNTQGSCGCWLRAGLCAPQTDSLKL